MARRRSRRRRLGRAGPATQVATRARDRAREMCGSGTGWQAQWYSGLGAQAGQECTGGGTGRQEWHAGGRAASRGAALGVRSRGGGTGSGHQRRSRCRHWRSNSCIGTAAELAQEQRAQVSGAGRIGNWKRASGRAQGLGAQAQEAAGQRRARRPKPLLRREAGQRSHPTRIGAGPAGSGGPRRGGPGGLGPGGPGGAGSTAERAARAIPEAACQPGPRKMKTSWEF